MYSNNVDEVNAFLGWLEENGKGIGKGNVKDVYAEFQKAIPKNEYYKHYITDKTTKHETARTERDKMDKIFKKGDKVYVQKEITSSFSVRHEVISTDPNNNTITIQLEGPYKAF